MTELFTFPDSLQEKEEKIKTVEVLLETGLIQVANKEEELKVSIAWALSKNSVRMMNSGHIVTVRKSL